MSKTLVAYYSWSGNTEKIAQAIAEALCEGLEEVRETRARRGALAYVRAEWS